MLLEKKARTNATLTTRYAEHSLMIAPLVTDTAKLSIDSPTANNNISKNDIADKLDIKMLKKQKLCPIFSDTTFCIESDYISSAIYSYSDWENFGRSVLQRSLPGITEFLKSYPSMPHKNKENLLPVA